MESYISSKKIINDLLDIFISKNVKQNDIQDALRLALSGGKRLRPIITLIISNIVNKNNESNYNLDKFIVLSELIHTASLIIDDLPCMDNDNYRRDNPTIHYKYGERAAQVLTTYIMTNVFNLFYMNLKEIRDKNISDVNERENIMALTLSNTMGFNGAPFGQYLDITTKKPFTKDKITTLIEKKTGTFFELAFVFGYIGSGGDIKNIDKIRDASISFGIAFQISDDFQDSCEDLIKDGCPNFVNDIGNNASKATFTRHLQKCRDILRELNLYNQTFQEIFVILCSRVK